MSPREQEAEATSTVPNGRRRMNPPPGQTASSVPNLHQSRARQPVSKWGTPGSDTSPTPLECPRPGTGTHALGCRLLAEEARQGRVCDGRSHGLAALFAGGNHVGHPRTQTLGPRFRSSWSVELPPRASPNPAKRSPRRSIALACATKTALRMLARQWQHLDTEFKTVRDQLRALTEQAAPSLRELPGVGGDNASAILTAVGDNIERIPNSAAFAALCGASPIEASSGKTSGYRLNRGGNRQANAALHRVVLVRISQKHPETLAYVERRTAEGKSRRAIIRCLKRYVAREVYQALTDPQSVAERFQRPINAEVRIEKCIVHDPALSHAYDQWLTDQEQAKSAA